jgi:hypothetical protein
VLLCYFHPQVLRHFHDDSVKLQTAVDHLIDIGFMSRRDVLRAGGVNMLWGLLLQVSNRLFCRCSSLMQCLCVCITACIIPQTNTLGAEIEASNSYFAFVTSLPLQCASVCCSCCCVLLQDVNAAIVATNAGTRLTLGELDADGVEAWVDHKKAQVASKLIALEMRGEVIFF